MSAGSSMLSGNYGMIKGIASNQLDNGRTKASDHSTSHAAIAAGDLTIRNDGDQQNLTGQTAAQAIAAVNRDTTDTS